MINRFCTAARGRDIAERSGSMDKAIKMQSENETRGRRSAENRRSGETLSTNICARKKKKRKKKKTLRVHAHRCMYIRMRHARFFSAIKRFAAYISLYTHIHVRIFIDSFYVSALSRRYSIIRIRSCD